MSGESPGASGVLAWSEDGAVEVFLRYTVSAHSPTAPSVILTTTLTVDSSTDTKTHRDDGVSISTDHRARQTQGNTIEACIYILRNDDKKSTELRRALVLMAETSITTAEDVDTAAELWMDSIATYVGQHLLALTDGRRSRSPSPARGIPPPPPSSMTIEAVTHAVQDGALSVRLHCLDVCADGGTQTRTYVPNVQVDAALLDRCATLAGKESDMLTYLSCWHVDSMGEDAPAVNDSGDQAILAHLTPLIPAGTTRMNTEMLRTLGNAITVFVTKSAGVLDGIPDTVAAFAKAEAAATHAAPKTYSVLCETWVDSDFQPGSGDHSTFNAGVPFTIVSVDSLSLPPPGAMQALDFLNDFLREIGYVSTHSLPYAMKATANSRAAGAKGKTGAVFAATGRTLCFNAVNDLSSHDMTALTGAVAKAWRREPLVFSWGAHNARAAVALFPGVERPSFKPNVPLRIKVTADATFAKLMVAISDKTTGPFVLRRMHPVASLATTLPLDAAIKTDVLLWFFLPSDVGRGAALAAALRLWAATSPKAPHADAGGAVHISMDGYHLETGSLMLAGKKTPCHSFVADDATRVDLERGDDARGDIVAYLHGVRNTSIVKQQRQLLAYVDSRLATTRGEGLFLPGKRSMQACLEYKMTGSKTKRAGTIMFINISAADFVAVVDLAADERRRYGANGALCQHGSKSFGTLTVEIAPPGLPDITSLFSITGVGVCVRCSLPGHEAAQCRQIPGICLQRSGGTLGGGCCRTRVPGPGGYICPSEVVGSTLACGYGSRKDKDHKELTKRRFALYLRQRAALTAWNYILYFTKQLALSSGRHLPGDYLVSPSPPPAASAPAEGQEELDHAAFVAAAQEIEAEEARRSLLVEEMISEGIWVPASREVKLQIGDAPERVVGGPLKPDFRAARSAYAQEEERAHRSQMRVEDLAAIREGKGTIAFLTQAGAMKGGRIANFEDHTPETQAILAYKWSRMQSQAGGQHRANGFAQVVRHFPSTPQPSLQGRQHLMLTGATPEGTTLTPALRSLMDTPQHDGRRGGSQGRKRSILSSDSAASGKRTKNKLDSKAPGAPINDAI